MGWVAYSAWQHYGNYTMVRVAILLLTLQIAILLVNRKPNLVGNRWQDGLVILPSLVGSAYIFHLAGPPEKWAMLPTVMYLVGGLFTGLSFLFLSNNFGLRPALRGVARRGTYKLVRHPAYSGELVMMSACYLASMEMSSAFTLLVIFGGQIARILAEEAVLKKSEAYQTYQQRVKWRLLPGVW